jgi:hypothetical protein
MDDHKVWARMEAEDGGQFILYLVYRPHHGFRFAELRQTEKGM